MIEIKKFTRTLDSFKEFLKLSGYDVEDSKNEWEILRTRKDNSVSSIFRNKKDELNFPDGLTKAYVAFQSGYMDMKKQQKEQLRERDGNRCFYCLKIMQKGNETLEHLLAVAHGGTDSTENIVLAHRYCNLKAGKLSLIEKIKIREKAFNLIQGD